MSSALSFLWAGDAATKRKYNISQFSCIRIDWCSPFHTYTRITYMHIAWTVSVDWERRIDFEQRLEWWIEDEFYWLNSWHDADTKTHSERTLYIFQIMCDPFCGQIIHQFEVQKQSTETDSNCLRIWLNDCSLYSPTRNKFRFEYMIFRFRIRLCVRVCVCVSFVWTRQRKAIVSIYFVCGNL